MSLDHPITPAPRRLAVAVGLIALLGAHAALFIYCAISKSACFDEPAHIAAGLAYLKYNETSIYGLSPPLMRLWTALPAYLDGSDIPPAKPLHDEAPSSRHWTYLERWQARNLDSVASYVLWGRLMQLPLSLALAAGVFLAARRLYGSGGGLLACGIYCLSPTVIAHASTVGTDLALAASFFAAVVLWGAFLRSGRSWLLMLACVAIGAAHAVKLNALLLWPVLVTLLACERALGTIRVRQGIVALVIALLVTHVIVCASYRYRLMFRPIDRFSFQSTAMKAVAGVCPPGLPLPLPRDLVEGFDAQMWEAEGVYASALFGSARFGGDWRYYPWLLLTKTTVGGLGLVALRMASFGLARCRREDVPLLLLVGIFVLGMTAMARINIGLRYLLPIYPAMAVLCARSWLLPRWRIVCGLLAAALAIESVAAAPRFHSFVNVAFRRWSWSVPDRDWGQSLIALRGWMAAQGADRVTLLYFGRVDPAAYGIHALDPMRDPPSDCIAISLSYLEGLPQKNRDGFVFVRPWRRLRQTPPVAELDGMMIYRRDDVVDRSGPWLAPIRTWTEALTEPELLPLRDLERRKKLDRP